MPVRFATLFRLLIVAALAVHVFLMYLTARVMNGGFGVDVGTFVLAALFAAAMLIPLLWAAWLADLPETLNLRRARKRFANAQCPACGYTIGGIDSEACPECGAALVEPATYRWSWRPLKRYAFLNVLALMLGIASGEAWLSYDEYSFRREAAAMQQRHAPDLIHLSRQRRWPTGEGVLQYETETGFTARR